MSGASGTGARPAAAVTAAAAEVPYRVRFDEAGPDGTLRTSGLLRYAQDVAWIHSETMGFDRAWYAARGTAWLVRSAELEVAAAIGVGELLLVRTEVVGFRKVWARRRTEVRTVTSDGSRGALAAWLHTDWVMIDEAGRPARVPPEIPAVFGTPPVPFTPLRVDLPPEPVEADRHEFAVRPHELDPMAHANNAVYVDWAEEIAERTPGGAHGSWSCRRARLEYLVPARPAERLLAAGWVTRASQDAEDGAARDRADGVAAPDGTQEVAVRIRRKDDTEVLRALLAR